MTNVSIREAGPADAATVALLMSEFNAILGADGLPDSMAFLPDNANVSPAIMARRLGDLASVEKVFVAWLDTEPAALACLRLVPYIGQDAPYAELTQLYVRPQFQRRGLGAACIAEVERRAVAAGATCVHLITGANMLDAQAFYRAQGYSMPGVEMVKFFVGEAVNPLVRSSNDA